MKLNFSFILHFISSNLSKTNKSLKRTSSSLLTLLSSHMSHDQLNYVLIAPILFFQVCKLPWWLICLYWGIVNQNRKSLECDMIYLKIQPWTDKVSNKRIYIFIFSFLFFMFPIDLFDWSRRSKASKPFE